MWQGIEPTTFYVLCQTAELQDVTVFPLPWTTLWYCKSSFLFSCEPVVSGSRASVPWWFGSERWQEEARGAVDSQIPAVRSSQENQSDLLMLQHLPFPHFCLPHVSCSLKRATRVHSANQISSSMSLITSLCQSLLNSWVCRCSSFRWSRVGALIAYCTTSVRNTSDAFAEDDMHGCTLTECTMHTTVPHWY